jgi:hypothetical protein
LLSLCVSLAKTKKGDLLFNIQLNMKKNLLYGILAVMLSVLSSCLGDPATNLTLANQTGVISTNPLKSIYVKGGDIISSTDFQTSTFDEGECVLFDYAIDMNQGPITQDGISYRTATIYNNTITKINQWPIRNELGDTITPTTNELSLSLVQSRFSFIKGKLFLFTEIANHKTAQVDSFSLSYNPAQQLGNDVTYDLYLHTIRQKTDSTTGSAMIIPCAFDIQSFVNNATGKDNNGTKQINFRINYVSSFNNDTTKCVWKSSDIFTIEKQAN